MAKGKNQTNKVTDTENDIPLEYSLGINMASLNSKGESVIISNYENRSFTTNGSPKGYDIEALLRNKQDNMRQICELATYYYSSEPLLGNSVNNVLVPFSMSGWQLQGSSESVKKKYTDYYETIGLDSLMRDTFYEFFVYQNVYLYDRGSYWDIFPPHRTRVASVSQNGNPILEFAVTELVNRRYTTTKEGFLDTLAASYQGYPEEIIEGIKAGHAYIQLNPDNTRCLQASKSRWDKYATPNICEALRPLAKKQLISNYEDTLLSLGGKGFVHVKVGDKDKIPAPDKGAMETVGQIFKNAINGFPLAVTTWNVESSWRSFDTKTLFDKDKYAEVNKSILSSVGISGAIVTGDSSSGSFAQATVNLSTLSKRIEDAQDRFADFINKLNKKLAIEWRIAENRVPKFQFLPLNLQSDETFRAEVLKLYTQGLLSKETTLNSLDYSFEQEKARKQKENEDKLDEVFILPPSFNNQSSDGDSGGNPGKSDGTRTSDPSKSASGKAPKPSTS